MLTPRCVGAFTGNYIPSPWNILLLLSIRIWEISKTCKKAGDLALPEALTVKSGDD